MNDQDRAKFNLMLKKLDECVERLIRIEEQDEQQIRFISVHSPSSDVTNEWDNEVCEQCQG